MSSSRATLLVRALNRLRERIDATLPANGRGERRRHELLQEVLQVLNGTGHFEKITQQVPNIGALSHGIQRRLSESRFALPRAIYESTYFDTPVKSLIARGVIHPSEWDFVRRLASSLNVSPSLGQEHIVDTPPWMADVDESYQELRVWIRELALQDMLLAGMEAYLVPAGSGRPSTEIYGIVFGSVRDGGQTGNGRRRRSDSLAELNVERICIQHRARGSPSEVIADERSEATHLAMGEELFPFWQVVGDFHTHTYRDLEQLHARRGWSYSSIDEKMNSGWYRRMLGLGHRPRVALILALTRAARAGNRAQENWRGMPHVVRATIGKCHCFLAAYRIRPDGRYSTDRLTLRCTQLTGQQ